MKITRIVLSLVFLSLLSPRIVRASSLGFFDSFDGSALKSVWSYINGDGSRSDDWYVDVGKLHNRTNTYASSYLYLDSSGVGKTNSYFFSLDVKNINGVDQNFRFNFTNRNQDFYQIGYRYNEPGWLQDNNQVVLYKVRSGSYRQKIKCPGSAECLFQLFLTQGVEHKIRVEYRAGFIRAYFDNRLVFEYFDSDFVDGFGFGFEGWGGQFPETSENEFDNFCFGSDDFICPTVKPKVFVIPGLGAGWNERAMVLGETVSDDQWKMIPFLKVYDRLTEGLRANFLVENQDYFVWNYDWRRKIEDNVNSFDAFVNSKIQAGEKVSVVGHSLGGVIGRIWAQKNSTKVNKIISLGSPQAGVANAYEAWAGAKFSDSPDLFGIGFNLLVQLQRSKYKTRVETVRSLAPVLSDLLPTFSYGKKNGVVTPLPLSSYLIDKNLDYSNILSNWKAVLGVGQKTKEWLTIGERDSFDKILGLWSEGKVVGFTTADGDGTVLPKSASLPSVAKIQLSSDHGGLASQNVDVVLTELGLGVTIGVGATQSLGGKYVFYLGSPAEMRISCPNKEYVAADGFVLVDADVVGVCQVRLVGTENGRYHLVSGKTGTDDWQYFEGQINLGDEIKYDFDLVKNGLANSETNKLGLWKLIMAEIGRLGISVSNQESDGNKLLETVMAFRKIRKNHAESEQLLTYLASYLTMSSTPSASELQALNTKVITQKSLVDRLDRLNGRMGVRPNEYQAGAYKFGEQLMTKKEWGNLMVSYRCFKEI